MWTYQTNIWHLSENRLFKLCGAALTLALLASPANALGQVTSSVQFTTNMGQEKKSGTLLIKKDVADRISSMMKSGGADLKVGSGIICIPKGRNTEALCSIRIDDISKGRLASQCPRLTGEVSPKYDPKITDEIRKLSLDPRGINGAIQFSWIKIGEDPAKVGMLIIEGQAAKAIYSDMSSVAEVSTDDHQMERIGDGIVCRQDPSNSFFCVMDFSDISKGILEKADSTANSCNKIAEGTTSISVPQAFDSSVSSLKSVEPEVDRIIEPSTALDYSSSAL